jgi:hypothetical protein
MKKTLAKICFLFVSIATLSVPAYSAPPVKVGILVLDTGYFPSKQKSPKITIVAHDFSPAVPAFPGIRPGYTPRMDGTDSKKGSGTLMCDSLAQLTDANTQIYSVKIGDSGVPLVGVTPTAVKPALQWVSALGKSHPEMKWVCYLNYNLAAVAETLPLSHALSAAGIPLVIPVGQQQINLDKASLPVKNIPPGYLSVAVDNDNSDFGNAVSLASQNYYVAVVAVSKMRLAHPRDTAESIVARIKAIAKAKPSPRWANGKSSTGGTL